MNDVSPLLAGMPTPLPLELPFREQGTAVEMRLQAISFFLLALLLCTLAVRGLWNYLRRDLPWLPRLSFGKALAGVMLWGLLCFVVLTMISGARELMTPGAWKKEGLTYKLADDPADDGLVELRGRQMERLRAALLHFAALHQGRFPTADEAKAMPAELWTVPEAAGLRYGYRPGLSASESSDLLAWEPELDGERRRALLVNGQVVELTSVEIASRMKSAEGQP